MPVTNFSIAKGDGSTVDATSILLVMTLGAEHGAEGCLTAEGECAEKALDRQVSIIEADPDNVECTSGSK